MSELIDNRRHRIEALKSMILQLHDGTPIEDLKGRFRAVLEHSGASEISAMESELMAEGMPEGEIRRMCDLHVAAFRESLEKQPVADATPGHPVHTFRRENQVIGDIVALYRDVLKSLEIASGAKRDDLMSRWQLLHERLAPLDAHYKRKEYLVFPFLEKAGISAPPKVMWGVDDTIREQFKAAAEAAAHASDLSVEELRLIKEVVLEPLLDGVAGMVEKENKVLWPMALEHLSDADWGEVARQWGEFGAGFVSPQGDWQPPVAAAPEKPAHLPEDAAVILPSGHLSLPQLIAMLNTLPVDITFVDADDRVAFFSEGTDRVFARNRAIVGRRVQDCHPPSSIHIVQKIVDDMRQGARDLAEFWITMQGRFVHIRYFAVRDEKKSYLGCLEMTQDVTAIRALAGERRLLAEGEENHHDHANKR